MDIVLFQDVTTESALRQLEEDGQKYEGLYVDMNNSDERKYVKDSASMITGLLKKLDRARIDMSRDYKTSVEKEAESIRGRLEEANQPFTLLIDKHKVERAEILAWKKAKEDAAALVIKIESDHEVGILINDKRDRDIAEAKETARIELKERDKRIADKAKKDAEDAAAEQVEQARLDKIAAENAAIEAKALAKQQAIDADAARIKAKADAERQAIQVADDAKQALIDAEAKAKRKAEEAVQLEQDRVERERVAAQEEQARRERNTKHKGSINRSVLAGLMAATDITEKQGKKIIADIVNRKIPELTIHY